MAELKDIMERNNFDVELYTSQDVGAKPNKAELDFCLTSNGFTLPLPGTVTYFMADSAGRLFNVTRFEPSGKYAYEKLTVV